VVTRPSRHAAWYGRQLYGVEVAERSLVEAGL
jgi:hypothetical protein